MGGQAFGIDWAPGGGQGRRRNIEGVEMHLRGAQRLAAQVDGIAGIERQRRGADIVHGVILAELGGRCHRHGGVIAHRLQIGRPVAVRLTDQVKGPGLEQGRAAAEAEPGHRGVDMGAGQFGQQQGGKRTVHDEAGITFLVLRVVAVVMDAVAVKAQG